MATSSSILAWKIPWTEETGGLQFRESQSVRHDLATEHILKFIHLTIKQPSGFSQPPPCSREGAAGVTRAPPYVSSGPSLALLLPPPS